MSIRATFAAFGLAALFVHPVLASRQKIAPTLGPVLWSDLRVGMTRRQANDVLRTKSLKISTDCFAKVDEKFIKDRLAEVTVSGKSPRAMNQECAQDIEKTLLSKYGEQERSIWEVGSVSKYVSSPLSPFAAITSKFPTDRFRVGEWTRSDISILFTAKISTGTWQVSYAPNPAALPEAKF